MNLDIAIGIAVSLIFIVLIALFCLVLIRLYAQKIRSYSAMIHEKELARERAVQQAIVETQEQAFNDFSQDIHDDAGQKLTSINFQLEHLKFGSPEMTEKLEPISESLVELSKSLRELSYNLSRQVMPQALGAAIKSQCERLAKNTKIDFVADVEITDEEKLSENEKLFIYRIFQEAVNNMMKHSGATRCRIDVRFTPGFSMTVTDNGKGFDPGQARASLGIRGLQHRAELIGFALNIISAPGAGATIKLTES